MIEATLRALVLALWGASGCSLTTNLDALGGGGAATTAASSGGAGGSSSIMTASTAATGGSMPSGYREAVLSDNPVAYWRLGEAVGETVAADETGSHDAEYLGVIMQGAAGAITGDGDTAVEFRAGTGRGIQVSTPVLSFAGRAPMSLELWIAPGLVDSGYRRILSMESVVMPAEGYQILLNDGTGLTWARYSGGYSDGVSTEAPTLNEYHHVVATYDGMKMFLYVDGTLASSGVANELLVETGTPFTIGAKSDLLAGYGGLVDEVAVYDYALPGVVVVEHYLAGMPR